MIELLICVSIIAILAAMLMPALSRAKYSARLVVCMNNLKQIAVSTTMKAGENDGRFPERPANNSIGWGVPHGLRFLSHYDDRELINSFFDVNILQCPFSPSVDYMGNTTSTQVFMKYDFYPGWRLTAPGDGGVTEANRMKRIGVPMTLKTASIDKEFDILVADMELLRFGSTGWPYMLSAHPDRGTGYLRPFNPDGTSYWIGPPARGPIDRNFCRMDGSAFTMRNLKYEDSRMVKLPYKYNAYSAVSRRNEYTHLPPAN